MADDDRLTAALEEIRERNDHWITSMQLTEATVAGSPFGDLRRLLAALEAVLKVTDIWDSTAADLRKMLDAADVNAPTTAARSAIVSTSEGAAKLVRQAITRALTGEGAPDVPAD